MSIYSGSDLRALCEKQCWKIDNADLKAYCEGICWKIDDPDLRALCEGDCWKIDDPDLRALCEGACWKIDDPDLRALCEGDCWKIGNDDGEKEDGHSSEPSEESHDHSEDDAHYADEDVGYLDVGKSYAISATQASARAASNVGNKSVTPFPTLAALVVCVIGLGGIYVTHTIEERRAVELATEAARQTVEVDFLNSLNLAQTSVAKRRLDEAEGHYANADRLSQKLGAGYAKRVLDARARNYEKISIPAGGTATYRVQGTTFAVLENPTKCLDFSKLPIEPIPGKCGRHFRPQDRGVILGLRSGISVTVWPGHAEVSDEKIEISSLFAPDSDVCCGPDDEAATPRFIFRTTDGRPGVVYVLRR